MSKYANGIFYSSPYSNISPPSTSFDMARSSSHDSAVSTSHYSATSNPMSRCSSASSSTHYQTKSASMRRTSSSSSSQSTWIASPYRSCLNRGSSLDSQDPSSYLSDDDLLSLKLPVESIPNLCLKRTERKIMTTEEQIEHLRELQAEEEREDHKRRESGYPSHSSSRRKTVHFEPEVQRKRPGVKRRSTACRSQLRTLNGPM